MPVIGKNMSSWFYAYVEHIEIKIKTVNTIGYIAHILFNALLWVLTWNRFS
jgi:hypothetical protein